MDEYVGDSVAAPRFQTTLLGAFAVLAMLLAAVGIFGVISQSVAERTREIGIRRALGAEHAGVIRLVVGQGLALAGIGIVAGEVGALALTRLLQTLLFGVPPTDPLTFGAVPFVMTAAAIAATYWPARRAARIDPMEALRYE
jgi:putative ABC transport system permease protein